jgi:hypothetical protein
MNISLHGSVIGPMEVLNSAAPVDDNMEKGTLSRGRKRESFQGRSTIN